MQPRQTVFSAQIPGQGDEWAPVKQTMAAAVRSGNRYTGERVAPPSPACATLLAGFGTTPAISDVG